jgi:hypothetical protein
MYSELNQGVIVRRVEKTINEIPVKFISFHLYINLDCINSIKHEGSDVINRSHLH